MPGPNLAGSASGWLNSGNVTAADGAVAVGSASREEGFDFSSATLVAGTFGMSGGAGDTVNGITVQIHARQTGSINGVLQVTLARAGSPVGSTKSAFLTGSLTTYTFGGSGDNWGAGFTGGNLSDLQVLAFVSPNSSTNGFVDCEIDWITAAADLTDTTPDAFAFGTANPVARDTLVTSGGASITGISGPAPVVVSSGEWEKNGSGAWTSSAGTVSNGDYVRVRHVSSPAFSTATNTTITVGGVPVVFTSITEAADITPDAFSFESAIGVEPSSLNYSNVIAISGINTSADYSVSGGEVSVNGGAWTTAAGKVNNGSTVQLRGYAPGSLSGLSQVTLTITGVAGTFNIYTRAADTTPDPFAFTDQSGVPTATVIESNSVTISGIEAAAACSVTSGERSINGGAWTSSAGTVSNGDTVRVRHTSAAGASQSVNTTFTAGGVSDTFTTTTAGADSVPDAFSFTPATKKMPGRTVTSAAVAISGINVSVGVTCSASAEVSVNGGGWSTTGTISNGQTVATRIRSSSRPGGTKTATVTIGGVSGQFVVTTRRAPQQDI